MLQNMSRTKVYEKKRLKLHEIEEYHESYAQIHLSNTKLNRQ